jgi:L-lactate dehydrogenase complex protein LldG
MNNTRNLHPAKRVKPTKEANMAITTTGRDEQGLLCSRFNEKAAAVSAIVQEIRQFDEATSYIINLCGSKEACRIALSSCEESLSPPADALCHLKHEKIVAAPGLDPEVSAHLRTSCLAHGFSFLQSGMRSHLDGIDIGFTVADCGIAETGTLVISCPNEEMRLATMLCEYHVCVLRRSAIVADAFAAERQLLNICARPQITRPLLQEPVELPI